MNRRRRGASYALRFLLLFVFSISLSSVIVGVLSLTDSPPPEIQGTVEPPPEIQGAVKV